MGPNGPKLKLAAVVTILLTGERLSCILRGSSVMGATKVEPKGNLGGDVNGVNRP